MSKPKTLNATPSVLRRTLHSFKANSAVVAMVMLPSLALAQPVINDTTISWPDDGWYQVQKSSNYEQVCFGGTSCVVDPGTYNVINHTSGVRYDNLVVGGIVASPITVVGRIIKWPEDGGWYQVQRAEDLEQICAGTKGCAVDPGTYIVINHVTGARFENVQVSEPTPRTLLVPKLIAPTVVPGATVTPPLALVTPDPEPVAPVEPVTPVIPPVVVVTPDPVAPVEPVIPPVVVVTPDPVAPVEPVTPVVPPVVVVTPDPEPVAPVEPVTPVVPPVVVVTPDPEPVAPVEPVTPVVPPVVVVTPDPEPVAPVEPVTPVVPPVVVVIPDSPDTVTVNNAETPALPPEIVVTTPNPPPPQVVPPVQNIPAPAPAEDRIVYGKSAGFARTGDMNRDGIDDVVIGIGFSAHEDGPLLSWFDGATNEQNVITTTNLDGYIGDGAVADIDGDGDLDVAIPRGAWLRSDPGVGSVSWYEQTPAGWIERTIADNLPGHHYGEIRIADLDADGALDVVVRALSPDNVYTFLQRGDQWVTHTIPTIRREGLDVADLDADGLPDIVGNGFVLFADDPVNGVYTPVTIDDRWSKQDVKESFLANSTKSAAGDIDGDGQLDLVISQAEGTDQPIIWYKAPDDPRTQRWTPRPVEASIRSHQVLLTDIDQDGDIDVIGGESWGGTHRYVWKNNGSGGFIRRLLSDSGGCYNCVIVGSNLVGPTTFAGPVLSTPIVVD